MCILYCLRGASVILVVLGPLVVVLAIGGPVFVLWRSQARSATVLVIILLFIFHSCTLCRVFPTCSVVQDLEKKSSLMSPPRDVSPPLGSTPRRRAATI